MTMLDQMRRHKGWLKWSLGLVVLAFVIFYIPDFLVRNPTGAGLGRHGGHGRGPGDHRGRISPQLRRSAAGVSQRLRRQRQRTASEAARHRPADPPAAGRSAGGARPRPSGSASRPATRKCGSASSRRRRSRRTARSSASSATSSCCARSGPPLTPAAVRAVGPRRAGARQAARGADRLAVDDRQGARDRNTALRNDKVKLAVVTFIADSFRPEATATDAEVAAYFDAHQADFTIPEKRKVRYLLVDADAIRAKIDGAGSQHRARVQRRHRTVHDAGAGAREPHSPEDRRQGRRGGEGEGRGAPQAGQERRGLRRSWRRRIPKTKAAPRTAATSITSARARWCRSSIRSPSRWSPGRSAIWSRRSSATTSSSSWTRSRRRCARWPKCGSRSSISSRSKRRGPRRRIWRRRSPREVSKPADLDTAAKAHGLTVQESGFFARGRADCEPRRLAGSGRPRVRDEGRRRERRRCRRLAGSRSKRSPPSSRRRCRSSTR